MGMHRVRLRAIRLSGWLAVAALLVLSIVPPSMRPMTFLSSDAEHFTSFFLTGMINCIGYPRRFAASLVMGIAFAAVIELLQVPLPARHARLSDFMIDASAACIGSILGFLLVRIHSVFSSGESVVS